MFLDWLNDQLIEAGMREMTGAELAATSDLAAIDEHLRTYQAELDEERYRKFENLFPAEYRKVGETEFWPRHLYPKHMEFFRVGATYDERCLMSGNRTGKTTAAAYETSCHLTGRYPDWWQGRRFKRPVRWWAAGKTNESTRDIIQPALLGDIAYEGNRKTVDGSGIIPTDAIGRNYGELSWKQGSADLVDTVKIRHVSGGWSKLGLKSYQQGRGAFEGTSQHGVWVDEEPELDVYNEARMRTMTTRGIMMMTFTPLEGLTDTVLAFLPQEMQPGLERIKPRGRSFGAEEAS